MGINPYGTHDYMIINQNSRIPNAKLNPLRSDIN